MHPQESQIEVHNYQNYIYFVLWCLQNPSVFCRMGYLEDVLKPLKTPLLDAGEHSRDAHFSMTDKPCVLCLSKLGMVYGNRDPEVTELPCSQCYICEQYCYYQSFGDPVSEPLLSLCFQISVRICLDQIWTGKWPQRGSLHEVWIIWSMSLLLNYIK